MNMGALSYETLIRQAFGKAFRHDVGRACDPAMSAEADIYRNEMGDPENLAIVKAGTAYAMRIFTSTVSEEKLDLSNPADEAEWERFKKYSPDVINATTRDEIELLINNFRETVIDKYYEIRGDYHVLKP